MPGVTFLLQNYVSYAEINHYFFSKNQNKMERNNIIEKKAVRTLDNANHEILKCL